MQAPVQSGVRGRDAVAPSGSRSPRPAVCGPAGKLGTDPAPCAAPSSVCLLLFPRPPELGGPPPRRAVLSMNGLSFGVIRVDAEEKLSVLTVQDVGQALPGGEGQAGGVGSHRGLTFPEAGVCSRRATNQSLSSRVFPRELGFQLIVLCFPVFACLCTGVQVEQQHQGRGPRAVCGSLVSGDRSATACPGRASWRRRQLTAPGVFRQPDARLLPAAGDRDVSVRSGAPQGAAVPVRSLLPAEPPGLNAGPAERPMERCRGSPAERRTGSPQPGAGGPGTARSGGRSLLPPSGALAVGPHSCSASSSPRGPS